MGGMEKGHTLLMWWITLLQSGRLDVEIDFFKKRIMRFSLRDVNPGETGAAVYRWSKTPVCLSRVCAVCVMEVHGEAWPGLAGAKKD